MTEQSGGNQTSNQQPAPTPPEGKTSSGIQPNVAGLLCYVLGWVTGIIFLIIEKENSFIRFHAIQSIVVFGVLTVAMVVFNFLPVIGWIINVISFILWIVLMYQAYQGKKYKIPWAGNIAEKQSKTA